MTNSSRFSDLNVVREVARADYEDLRKIARKPGATIVGTGAEIDAELDRRTRAHVEGMSGVEAIHFLKTYNEEYNRLVTAKLRQGNGCMIPLIIWASSSGGLLYLISMAI